MIDCPKCKNEMIWGGDHDLEDDDGKEIISSNLSCPHCETMVDIYWGTKDEQ